MTKKSFEFEANRLVVDFSKANYELIVYDDCGEISFADFLRCLNRYDYSSLIVSGSPSERLLKEKWLMVLGSFYAAKGDQGNEALLVDLICQMAHARSRTIMIYETLRSMKQFPPGTYGHEQITQGLQRCLNELGLYVWFPLNDGAGFFRQLQTANNNAIRFIKAYNDLHKRADKLLAKARLSPCEIMRMLRCASANVGYQVEINTITAGELAAIINPQYNER